MRILLIVAALTLPTLLQAEKKQLPGGKVLPHDKYIHVVSEAESPIEQVYIRSKDGMYVAAAVRKPKGAGPFPALIHFHGAPGGRGMEKLVTWARGDDGGPMWERFLREGFTVIVADYRNLGFPVSIPDAEMATYVDDGLAVVEWARQQPYIDANKIFAYGVSLGGNLTAHLIGRTKLAGAVLGAPAVFEFLSVERPPRGSGPAPDSASAPPPLKYDPAAAKKNIEAMQCDVLLLVGTKDSLIRVDELFHDEAAKAGKPVTMLIYENGYHDFVMGPQGHAGREEPLLDATLDALDKTVEWAKARAGILHAR
jgi:dipeptidyl aminopeptidase/acylaminoacyl peptidase